MSSPTLLIAKGFGLWGHKPIKEYDQDIHFNTSKKFQLYKRKFYKLTLIIFLLFSCDKRTTRVEGTWLYVNQTENGKEIKNTEQTRNRKLQFTETGELRFFHINKKVGLGLYYYTLKGDSLYVTNVQLDTMGKIDTLGISQNLISFKEDTLYVGSGNKITCYEREKK